MAPSSGYDIVEEQQRKEPLGQTAAHPLLSDPSSSQSSPQALLQTHTFDSLSSSTPSAISSSPSPSVSPLPASSSSLTSTLKDVLQRNPVFSGGAGLAVVGIAAASGRELLRSALRLTRKYFTVSLEIPSKDRSYQWVLQWISKQQPTNRPSSLSPSLFSSSSSPSSSRLVNFFHALTRQQHLGVETSFSQSASGVISTHFDFVPSPGEHSFWYKGRLVHYSRVREKSMIDMQSGSPWETVTLRTFGRSQQLMIDLLQEAKAAALRKQENRTIIYTSSGIDWRPFGQPRKKRPLESVVLDRGVGEKILNDFQDFLQSQSWYVDRGIPYRRGYLLYGPPGCGKSSFIQALAGRMQYNICVLNLNERSLTDDKLAYLLSTLPPRSLLLLEDVDAAFQHRDQRTTTLTFSGLLNALDGVASTEERVIFMTTNHLQRLDPALIRPGRVDVQQYVGMSSEWQMREMWKRFYEGEEEWERMGEEFVREMRDVEVSMAELQGFFLLYKGNARGALEGSKEWRKVKEEEMRRRSTMEREKRRREKEAEKIGDVLSEDSQSHLPPVSPLTPPSSKFIMSK